MIRTRARELSIKGKKYNQQSDHANNTERGNTLQQLIATISRKKRNKLKDTYITAAGRERNNRRSPPVVEIRVNMRALKRTRRKTSRRGASRNYGDSRGGMLTARSPDRLPRKRY